ncbi:MAG: LysR family transcriptional regulator [Chloroflexi bacterium]|nr:LysR family transcriptional regulator [Chloroflexota bacterium]
MLLNLAQIDMNLLVVLDALLNERNVTRAGERVGLSQPAMSNALQRLRRLFNDELMVRVGRHYELTAEGEALIEPLREALQRVGDLLEERPTFDPARAQRSFTVAVSDYVLAIVVRPLLRRLASEAPCVRLRLEPLRGSVADLVRNGQLDLAIMPTDSGAQQQANELPHETLLRDSWVCVAWSENHAVGERLTRETFQSLPHVVDMLGSSPTPASTYLGSRLAGVGIERRALASLDNFMLMPFLIEGTPALAVLQRRLAEWLCQTAALRILELPFDIPNLVDGMYWSPRHTSDPAHVWLRTLFRETAAGLA